MYPYVVSSSYIARQLGISASTVSNWQRRKVLPSELLPLFQVDNGGSYCTSVWLGSQVPMFVNWYAKRHPRKEEDAQPDMAAIPAADS